MALLLTFAPEYLASSPEPKAAPVIRQQTTHSVMRGTDNTLTLRVRDEAGAHDLSVYDELTAQVRYYASRTERPAFRAHAERGESTGEVIVTMTAHDVDRMLPGNLYRLDVMGDGRLLYPCFIEVH